MKIGGPFFNAARRTSPKKWWLSYFVPKLDAQGAPVLVDGKVVLVRHRPYYESKTAAQEDKARIAAQYGSAGAATSMGGGVLSREQAAEYEAAKGIVAEVSLDEVARFYRRHHPLGEVAKVAALVTAFLTDIKPRTGARHYQDLDSRLGKFSDVFGERIPETLSRVELLSWLTGLGLAGRTILNQKRAVVTFCNWLVERGSLSVNPVAGVKRKRLPRCDRKEIAFLSLDDLDRYLAALERYDPELVAHEVIQLFAGVRADDEMADFDGRWVLPATREVVIPAEIAKTGRREVIDGLEANFWDWWSAYGREGILRPRNYDPRWRRVRVLMAAGSREQADRWAAEPIKLLLATPEARARLTAWPWNARRRTFCTYHVAKEQSAGKTALILRHRGAASTLHNSYRGTGVTQAQGAEYFERRPRWPGEDERPAVIAPARVAKGIVARRKLTR